MSTKTQQNQHLPYLDDFLLSMQTDNYSPRTLYNYERDLKTFEEFLRENNIPFQKINKNSLLNYKAYLASTDRQTAKSQTSENRLSAESINRMLSALRSYFNFLVDMDHEVPVAPDVIKLLKKEKKKLRVSERDALLKLVEAPTKLEKDEKIAVRNRAMLEVLISTGVRISELIHIKKTDIDKQGRIFIRGKGKKERFVYLTERAQKHLQKYLEFRDNTEASPFLFLPFSGRNVNKKDKKMSPNYIQDKLKRYRELLGINVPISPHSIRHAFATYLAEQGADPSAIQRMLGHESLDTTTRYVNIADRHAQETHKRYHPFNE